MSGTTAAPKRAEVDARILQLLSGPFTDIESVRTACSAMRDLFAQVKAEIEKVFVGQTIVVEQALVALLANGHVLLEGVPGLGKTLLVRTLATVLELPYSRIQFTPDLMPADITGTSIVAEDPVTGRRSFTFNPGPIFAQLVLADEINRATPKSQAALLEAMQERSVTVAGQTFPLKSPFFVLATQNPIEQEGTYPLPEAQLDRFMFKVQVPFTTKEEMSQVLGRTTTEKSTTPRTILNDDMILKAQTLARNIVVADHVQDFAIRFVLSTQPGSPHMPEKVAKYVSIGVSPRAAQSLVSAAKVVALIDGRYAIGFKDIVAVSLPSLRHRIIRSFEAEAEGVTTDAIIRRLLEALPREAEA
ncbi:MAG TPA: MoxR family ATPase [Phycisphaerales bacterium]|nr:MoxR family ATPase [Phycisphaerales bacterium]